MSLTDHWGKPHPHSKKPRWMQGFAENEWSGGLPEIVAQADFDGMAIVALAEGNTIL